MLQKILDCSLATVIGLALAYVLFVYLQRGNIMDLNSIVTSRHVSLDQYESRGNKYWQDKFSVTITNRGKSHTFDYSMGIGHRKPNKHAAWRDNFKREYARIGRMVNAADINDLSAPTKPDPLDVIYSLLLDADLGNQTFHDFCSDLGFNEDSIKDRRTYFACQENATKMRELFNGTEIEELRELTKDY